MNNDIIQTLGKTLLQETLKTLLERVRSGEATAAELNVARQAVKDLNIQMLPTPGNAAGQLIGALKDLPFPGEAHAGLDE